MAVRALERGSHSLAARSAMPAPTADALAQPCRPLDHVLELLLLGVLGGQLLGCAVIVHILVTRVDEHHPRNFVRVLAGEQACRLARD